MYERAEADKPNLAKTAKAHRSPTPTDVEPLCWIGLDTQVASPRLGFVLAKFGAWLSPLGARLDPHGDGAADTVQPNPS